MVADRGQRGRGRPWKQRTADNSSINASKELLEKYKVYNRLEKEKRFSITHIATDPIRWKADVAKAAQHYSFVNGLTVTIPISAEDAVGLQREG